MASPETVHIDGPFAAFLESGVSICMASQGPDRLPNLVRALGCQVEDGGRIRLFMSRLQGPDLLADLRANGHIAVVFSMPSTAQSVQLKGTDAVVEPFRPGDASRVDAYREAFIREVVPLGYAEELLRTFLSLDPRDMACVSFTPAEAYHQSPGPNAGDPLPP
jgi:hypothetical protein